MQIQYKLTFQDFLASQALHAKRGILPRFGRIFIFYVMPILGILFWSVVLFGAAARHWEHFDWSALVAGGWFIGLGLLLRWAYWSQFRRTISQSGESTLNFDDNLIYCQSAHAKSEMEWALFQRVAEDKKLFLLYLALGKFLVVPKRVCSAEQVEELRALLQAKIAPQRKK